MLGVGLLLSAAGGHAEVLHQPLSIPLAFEPNVGQVDPRVSYLSRGDGYTLFLTDDGMTLALARGDSSGGRAALHARFVGAEPATSTALLERQAGVSHYLIGNDASAWRRDVPLGGRVRYRNIYPGVDVEFYGTDQRQLEYDFVVAPGADYRQIELAFDGGEALRLDATGQLVISTRGGDVVMRAPVTYQTVGGERHPVESRFILQDGRLTFDVAPYDPDYALVIDPVLSYSSYFGGTGNDEGRAIALDSSGNTYITGRTASTDLPLASAYDGTQNGSGDLFVTKLNAAGSALTYSTYIGGSGDELARSISVDASGNAYVSGYTLSADFPTVSPIQGALAGARDLVLLKLNAAGSALTYSTYYGGTLLDDPYSSTIDASGNFYVTGETRSTDFPTASAYQGTHGGGTNDAFLLKINAAGSAATFSTYLGGSGDDDAWAIAVDGSGNSYITGGTASTDFPTASPYQGANAGNDDAFVTKFNAAGSALTYSTYLGGTGNDKARALAIDGAGNAYVAAMSASTDFPTQSPYQASNGGGAWDVTLTKLNAAGSALTYSTYFGGSDEDRPWDLVVDDAGAAVFTGQTASTNLPTQNAIQGSYGGGTFDAYVARILDDGDVLAFSTYLGGSDEDIAHGIALGTSGSIYIAGLSRSTNLTTASPYQGSNAGVDDAFVAKISPSGSETTTASGLSGTTVVDAGSEAQILTAGITGDGTSHLHWVELTISDLSSATGIAAGDFSQLRLYKSTDATLDAGDTQIGSQSTVNIGSVTRIDASSPQSLAASEAFFIVAAVMNSGATSGRSFKVGAAAGAFQTSITGIGSAVAASDANKVTVSLSETATATGLSGTSVELPGAEVALFSVGVTGDGTSSVTGVSLTLADLSSSTGLSAADVTELRFYQSTDATFDGGDSLMATQSSVNVGSATTLSGSATPAAGTQRYYLVTALLSSSATSGHAFTVGFSAGGLSTGAGTRGTAVSAADANNVTVALTESVAASVPSGTVHAVADSAALLLRLGLTGDGSTAVTGATVTITDLASATGLVAADLAELRLYASVDATLDGTDSLLGTQTTVNVGSATTVSGASTPPRSATRYYLVAVVPSAGATAGHALKTGFAAGGVAVSGGTRGTAVTASDNNRVTIAARPSAVALRALGLDEGATAAVTSSLLRFSDNVSSAGSLIYTVDEVPSAGRLSRNAVELTTGGTFTQQDLDDSLVTYRHFGYEQHTDGFRFRVRGVPGYSSSTQSFAIDITPTPDRPSLNTLAALRLAEGGRAVVTNGHLRVLDGDTPSTQVVFTVSSAPAHGQLNRLTFSQSDVDNAGVHYTHDGGETTTDAFTVSVADESGEGLAGLVVPIVVTPTNDWPVAPVVERQHVVEGDTLRLDLIGTDPDGDELEVLLPDLPEGAVLQGSRLSWVPGFDQAGVYSLRVTVRDSSGLQSSSLIEIEVLDGDAPPRLAAATALRIDEGTTGTITSRQLQVVDEESPDSLLLYTILVPPRHGALSLPAFTQRDISLRRLTYQHDGSETRRDSFVLVGEDGARQSTARATFRLFIAPVNDPPVAPALEPRSVLEGHTLSVDLSGSDPEQGALVVSVDAMPDGAVLDSTGLSWTPGYDQAGLFTLDIVVRDEGALADTTHFQIEVIDVALPGDFSGDGVIDRTDVDLLLQDYGQTVPPASAQFDLNGDGRINWPDAVRFADLYPTPSP